MHTSRMVIALGVLGAFAAGLGIGLYVNEPLPHSTLPPGSPGATAGGALPLDGAAGAGSSLLGPDGQPLTGSALVERFWSCLTIPDEFERQQAWLALLSKLNKDDAVAVRELFLQMDKQGRRMTPEWEAFWPRWGMVDGAAAMEYLSSHENAGWRPQGAEKIMRGWGQTDPAAAMEWLRANRDSPMFSGALRGFVDGFAKSDLDRATEFVLNEKMQSNDLSTGKLMESLAERALQQRKLGGMSQWFDGLPTTEAKQAALGSVYYRLHLADKMRAMEWLGLQAGQPWRNDGQISDLAVEIAQQNPQAAFDWATSLPPSPQTGRYNGLKHSVQSLAAQDAPAVEQWLAKPDLTPAMRDQGTAAYAQYLLDNNLPNAQDWAKRVTDQSLMTRTQNTARLLLNSKSGTVTFGDDLQLKMLVQPQVFEPSKPR